MPREITKDDPAVEPKEEPAAPAPDPDTFEAKFTKLTEGKGANALVARYLENHGRWEVHTHRSGTGSTVELRQLVFCGCPICTDARALLKLED